jgi:hypothetical protein
VIAASAPEGIPGFSFVWQFVTIFAFVVALWRAGVKRRDPGFDAFMLVTRYSVVGMGIGLCVLFVAAVL